MKMYCITRWTLIYFTYEQFSDEWVQALYTVPSETDKGQILWHSHLRHTPGNLLLFMEIIISMPLKMKRQKSPCRSRLGCLEVQIESEKRVVLFSWQPLGFDSWNLQAWSWESGLWLHPVFRFTHQRIQNGVERKRSESTTERGSLQGELLQWLLRAAVWQCSKAFFCVGLC